MFFRFLKENIILSTCTSHIFSIVIEAFKFLTGEFKKPLDDIEIENISSNVEETQNEFETFEMFDGETIKEEAPDDYNTFDDYTPHISNMVIAQVCVKKRKIREENFNFSHDETRIFPPPLGDGAIVESDFFHVSNNPAKKTRVIREERNMLSKISRGRKERRIEPQQTTPTSKDKIDMFKARDDF
jgi:hypothetical protein